jgi:16S rRNA U516 pseudouridylate synthase RsuA-like enzyme
MSEYIAHEKVTQRTETSKYLQEKKITMISQVAASEQEEGQTRKLAFWGCRTAMWT